MKIFPLIFSVPKQHEAIMSTKSNLMLFLILVSVLCLSRTTCFVASQKHYNHRLLQTPLFMSSMNTPTINQVPYSCTITKLLHRRRWRRRSQQYNKTLRFDYNATELLLKGDLTDRMRAVLLIHPIGVGIGRWYYDRLLDQFAQREKWEQRTLIVAPDLLACGTASRPKNFTGKIPLLTVQDWSEQLVQVMQQVEQRNGVWIDWCIVSNGGCVPLAFETGALYVESGGSTGNLTNIVLSAAPRLPNLLQEPPPPERVRKSYETLSGIAGKIFWWYALRNNGAFIQAFSERSLMADRANMGDDWTPQCVANAKIPDSKYSAFAFLAGSLQHDCRRSISILRDRINIDIIRTNTKRGSKSARSWFWDRRRRLKPMAQDEETLSQFLNRNGNRGSETFVGGRTCPAYEDTAGYANALRSFLGDGVL
jgi:hypothetical protein